VTSPVRLALVGLGYWGPHFARIANEHSGAELVWCCDRDEAALDLPKRRFPHVRRTREFQDVIDDESVDAVIIATPTTTHADLAVAVMDAGKHCFVEKPLAQSSEEGERVMQAARGSGRVLMVGHLLEYHPGVEMLKELIDSGELGEVRYLYSNRLNLGVLRPDENALWSLGAHDVSVLLRLAGEEPYECRAVGESYMQEGIEDVVFCYLRFPSGLAAHLHLSWLDPHKERRFTVVGSRKMATFDDMELERKLTVYDKGFDESWSSYGEYIARSGDIFSPRVPNDEPLLVECRHFVERVQDGAEPRSGGEAGLRVVRVLVALQQSLRESSRAARV